MNKIFCVEVIGKTSFNHSFDNDNGNGDLSLSSLVSDLTSTLAKNVIDITYNFREDVDGLARAYITFEIKEDNKITWEAIEGIELLAKKIKNGESIQDFNLLMISGDTFLPFSLSEYLVMHSPESY